MLRLLRLTERNQAASPLRKGGPQPRASSPRRGSILMTSAPMSARYMEAVGAAYDDEMSTTRTPARGCLLVPSSGSAVMPMPLRYRWSFGQLEQGGCDGPQRGPAD